MTRSIKRPSPGFVLGALALFISLGATAMALPGVNTVTSNDIRRGNVRTSDIAANAVRSGKINDGTVFSRDIADGTVRSGDVANSTLTGEDVDNGSLNSGDLGPLTGGLTLSGSGPGSGLTFANGSASYGLYNQDNNFLRLDNELILAEDSSASTGLFLDGEGSIAINAGPDTGGTLRINGESPNVGFAIVLDNQALLFLRDAGGGKEEMCVKFNSGIDCFALEP